MVLAVMVLFLITLCNWLLFQDTRYPGFINAFLWSVVVTAYTLYQDYLPQLSAELLTIVIAGVMCFTFGALLSTGGHKPAHKSDVVIDMPKGFWPGLMLWVSILGFPFYIWRAYELMGSGPFKTGFANLRLALSLGDGYGWLGYLVPLSCFSAGIQILLWLGSGSQKIKMILAVSIGIALVYAVLATGRTYLFQLLLLIASVGIVLRRFSVIKTFSFCGLTFIAIFLIYSIVLNKGGNLNASFSENIKNTYGAFIGYFLGPLAALNYALNETVKHTFNGLHVFRTFYAIFEAIGFDVKVIPLVQNYAPIQPSVNVYTVYHPYFLDYSWVGIGAFQFIAGVWHGYLYKEATMVNPRGEFVILYGLFMYPLLMQFFQDQYFSLTSTWIQFFAYMIVIFFIPRLRIIR